MTPAIKLLAKHNIPHHVHTYDHDPNHGAYGLEAAERLNVNPAQVFKTLIIEVDAKALVCAIIPVAESLNLKLLAKAAGAKKAVMADISKAERSTGYIKGGVSPFAQKKPLQTFVDASALEQKVMYVSGGKRGMDISIAPADLIATLEANTTKLCV